jgi:hypothetical protein
LIYSTTHMRVKAYIRFLSRRAGMHSLRFIRVRDYLHIRADRMGKTGAAQQGDTGKVYAPGGTVLKAPACGGVVMAPQVGFESTTRRALVSFGHSANSAQHHPKVGRFLYGIGFTRKWSKTGSRFRHLGSPHLHPNRSPGKSVIIISDFFYCVACQTTLVSRGASGHKGRYAAALPNERGFAS